MFRAVMMSDPAAASPPRALARKPEASRPASEEAPASPPPPLLNPSVRIESALNLVVLEFRDANGEVRTIPTARELDAYRNAPPEAAPAIDVEG